MPVLSSLRESEEIVVIQISIVNIPRKNMRHGIMIDSNRDSDCVVIIGTRRKYGVNITTPNNVIFCTIFAFGRQSKNQNNKHNEEKIIPAYVSAGEIMQAKNIQPPAKILDCGVKLLMGPWALPHISCHAFFKPASPSGLIFGQTPDTVRRYRSLPICQNRAF